MLNPPNTIIESWIREHFQKCKKRGSELNAVCALCGDSKRKPGKKKRFFFNLQSGRWFCHNCNDRGNDFYSLVAKHDGVKYGDAVGKFRQHLLQNIQDVWKKPEEILTVVDEGEEFDVEDFLKKKCFRIGSVCPNGMIKKSLFKRAVSEIELHGVYPKDYPFFGCHQGDYRGRLIIPFYNKGRVVYFQGRAIAKNLLPKYKNCPTPKGDYVFNEECFHPQLPIFVFEGFWEPFILERYLQMNGTALLGKHIPEGFIPRLLKLTEGDINICFDNDEAGRTAVLGLEGMPERVKVIVWQKGFKYKDISEMWARFRDTHSIKDFLKTNIHSIWRAKVLLHFSTQ